MADVTARWPFAVGVSVAAHGGIALVLVGLWGRAIDPAPKPAVQKPAAVEVFRIGSLMPRTGGQLSGATPAAARSTAVPHSDANLRREHPTPAGLSADRRGATDARPADHPTRPEAAAGSTSAPAARAELGPPTNDLLPANVAAAADQPTPTAPGGPAGDAFDANGAVVGERDGEGVPLAAASGDAQTKTQHGAPSTVSGADHVIDPRVAAEVHARLARAANDCYPPQARRFRQRGQVPVSFCVEGEGLASKVVVASSGAALLDEATRACVMNRAEPFPAAAAGSCFSVSVEFGSAGVHVSR